MYIYIVHTRTHTHTHTGLCRTCEIFGVSELVLGNMSVVEDTQFTALSVSAQHWLKISEVSRGLGLVSMLETVCVCVCVGSYTSVN